jgi:hypothetical protein
METYFEAIVLNYSLLEGVQPPPLLRIILGIMASMTMYSDKITILGLRCEYDNPHFITALDIFLGIDVTPSSFRFPAFVLSRTPMTHINSFF